MKKTILLMTVFLCLSILGYSQTNLIAGWNGNGAAGTGSEANNFGWSATGTVTWGETDGASVRFQDTGHSYGKRVLYIRWESGVSAGNCFAYKITGLEKGKLYQFTGRYAWHSNGGTAASAVFTIGVNSDSNNGGTSYASSDYTVSAKGAMHDASFSFIASGNEGADYYLTFTNNIALLAAITDLSIVEADAPTPENIEINNETVSIDSYLSKNVTVNGKSEVHITSNSSTALYNSTINLTSVDAWLFFDNIRPSKVISDFLGNVQVNGTAAKYTEPNETEGVNRSNNVRVSMYKHGTVIIPHAPAYQPLTIYTEQNFGGSAKSFDPHKRHMSFGDFDNRTRSFKLKRGYAATFATNADGTGYSRVFIADTEDIEMSILPDALDETVSFVRVVHWHYTTKKGWAGGHVEAEMVDATWNYDWGAGNHTRPNMEYTIIKAKDNYPGWGVYDREENTQLLAFNEPDRPDQSNMTNALVLERWPDFMKAGVRVGSPAYSSATGSGLYAFMDSCDARGYRVDFVAVHCYWGGMSAGSWYNNLKYIYERCGKRPLWITEWNNGANWTGEGWPTASKILTRWNSTNNVWEEYTHNRPYTPDNATKQLNDLTAIVNMLDTASFIERYSIYNWVQDARAMTLYAKIENDTVKSTDGYLTQAGEFYKNNKSVYYFNRKNEIIPSFKYKSPTLRLTFGTSTDVLNITKNNGDDFDRGFVVERKINDGEYEEIYRETDITVTRYSGERELVANSNTNYRVRSILKNGDLSEPSNEANYNVTSSGSIKIGNLKISNVDYNTVFFNDGYEDHPAVILGAPTNNNGSTTLLTVRAKQVTASSRFTVQLAPWKYQDITSLKREENIPYMILPTGTYKFGSLDAVAGRVSANGTWTKIEFDTPFTTIPVVFVGESNAVKTNATTIRVRNISNTGFEVCLQQEAAQTGSFTAETISYLAITEGEGLINGCWVKVAKTESTYSTTAKKISYGDDVNIENPVFVAQMQTANDDYTSALRTTYLSGTYANVVKQVEKSSTVGTIAAETIGWMLVDTKNTDVNVKTPVADQFSVYPNPAVNELFFEGDFGNANVEIYTLAGVLVKNKLLTNNKIIVSDLTTGTYFAKVKGFGTTKFIKR